jgi:dTMP kinase
MFISFEGIEGSGKTTQIQHAVEFFKGKGVACTATREPGGTEIGRKIREILLDPSQGKMDPMTELLLYTADRAQHLKEIVIPDLKNNRVVLCDRYFDATIVYQGYARGIDIQIIKGLHELLCDNFKPDRTILLDLTPKIGLSRAWKQLDEGSRTENESRFELEKLSFHEKVRNGYLALSRQEPNRFCVIDAGREETVVKEAICDVLSAIYHEKPGA